MSLRLDRCPICRAKMSGDEPLREPCRRCGSDLSLVRAAERQAELALGQACATLAFGQAEVALGFARRAAALVDHPATREVWAAVLGVVVEARSLPERSYRVARSAASSAQEISVTGR